MADPAQQPIAPVETPPQDPPAGNPETPEDAPLFVARSQKDLDKRFGAEKRAAAEARDKALMEKFGVDSLDELDEIVADHRAILEATESETEALQRSVAEKDEAIRKANEERDNAFKLADSRLVDSELKGALIDAGVSAERVRKILNDPEIEKPGVEDGKVSDVESYVESAKKEWPELFGSKSERVPESPSPSNGSNPEADEKARQDFQRSASRKF